MKMRPADGVEKDQEDVGPVGPVRPHRVVYIAVGNAVEVFFRNPGMASTRPLSVSHTNGFGFVQGLGAHPNRKLIGVFFDLVLQKS